MLTKENIEKYFIAEKAKGMLFMAIKIAVKIAAVVCFVIVKSALCRGKFMPQLAIGLLLYYKSHALFVQVCITEKICPQG